MNLLPCAALALITAAAAVLRFRSLEQKSVWIDEGVSIEMARLDWYNFLRILWRHEANMVLHTLLLRFWLIFGDSEAWLRSLSVLAALATIPAVFLLGKKLFNARVGLMASFLLTINAFHVRYSQEARSYSLFVFLAVLSTFYFLKFLEDPSSANRKAHVLTSVLAVYTHFFAGLLLVAQWLSLKLLDRGEINRTASRNWRQISIAITPLLIFVATTGVGVLRWIPRPDRTSIYISSIYLSGGGGNRLLGLYAAACAAAFLPVTPSFFALRRLPWNSWRYVFLAIWLVFPIAVVFLISQWKPCFLARYFIFTLPALGLLTAAGIERLRWRVLMGAALLAFAAWSLPAVRSGYSKDIDVVREDFRSATRYVLANAQPGDAILFYQPIGRMPYEYYRSLIPAAAFPIVVYPAYGGGLTFRDFYAGKPPESLLADVPSRHPRIWVLLTHNMLLNGPDPTTQFISALYAQRYSQLDRYTFPQIELRLYCRDTGPPDSCPIKNGAQPQ